MANLAPVDPRAYLPALNKLAARRQTDIDRATLVIYAEDLAHDGVSVVDCEVVCDYMGRQPSAAYQSAFPRIGDILAGCREIRQNRAKADEAKRLEDRERRQLTAKPMDDATAKLWLARIKAAAHGEPIP